jgi:phenylacetyl-CoA:acceptor oxidoreductase
MGLDWWREQGFATQPFPQSQWYLRPTLVERQGLRFELPYQERLKRVGEELGRRLHEHGMHWWDRSLPSTRRCLPGRTSVPVGAGVAHAGGAAGDYPFWLLTARSMQYAWGGNVGVQMITRWRATSPVTAA